MKVHVLMTLPDDSLAEGWAGDVRELAASVRATLFEINMDNGDIVCPNVVSVDVQTEVLP